MIDGVDFRGRKGDSAQQALRTLARESRKSKRNLSIEAAMAATRRKVLRWLVSCVVIRALQLHVQLKEQHVARQADHHP